MNSPIIAFAITVTALLISRPANAADIPAGYSEHFAEANGTKLHYFTGGKGSAIVLLHGYAQTSHMWFPIMPDLAQGHTVIVPDLRGAGDSFKPDFGYDKKNMAVDIHELVTSLGIKGAAVVGHDIGLMVAYAYAAQFPKETERLVLMDAFLPGIGNWKDVWLMRDLWHFHFHGNTALALVEGRERIYFEHFWNDFAADPKHSIPEADRQFYAQAYAQPHAMRSGFEYFRNFERDAQDFAALSATPLTMPVFVLTGEKASGNFLIEQARLVASNVQGQIIPGSGHWLMEEKTPVVIPALTRILDSSSETSSGLRLTAREIEALPSSGAGTGTSGVAGIQTRVLMGNPSQPGAYTIQLNVPGDTRIESHTHPDDRTVTVISGKWTFGFGTRFEEKELKELPAGSFYTEPANKPHFARTGDTPVVIHISGYGPSGTEFQK
jgi:pimeloyl-ACP methyl ester carboxylesterase/quercetin dioxygenase-like cupin family protein